MLAEVDESGPRCDFSHILGRLNPKLLCPSLSVSLNESSQNASPPNSNCRLHDLAEVAFPLAQYALLIGE